MLTTCATRQDRSHAAPHPRGAVDGSSLAMETIALETLQKLLTLTPEVLLGLVVIGVCYALKKSRFPNRWIPTVCMLLPSALYPLLATATATEGVASPLLRSALIGFVIGLVAWGIHNKVLKRFIDPRLFDDDDQPPPCAPEK